MGRIDDPLPNTVTQGFHAAKGIIHPYVSLFYEGEESLCLL